MLKIKNLLESIQEDDILNILLVIVCAGLLILACINAEPQYLEAIQSTP